jgi:hypothetical protein
VAFSDSDVERVQGVEHALKDEDPTLDPLSLEMKLNPTDNRRMSTIRQ